MEPMTKVAILELVKGEAIVLKLENGEYGDTVGLFPSYEEAVRYCDTNNLEVA